MKSNIPDVPDEFVAAVKEGRGVLFAGAGVSRAEIRSSGKPLQKYLPTWDGLLILLLAEASKAGVLKTREASRLRKAVKEKKYEFVAEAILETVGETQFDRVLRAVFRDPALKPTRRHRLIASIPFSAVVTTNYDKLLEAVHTKGSLPPATYTSVDDSDIVAALSDGRFFILKAHGDIDRRDTIILSTKQYRDLIYRRPGYRAALTTIFISRTVLFIGTSLNDIDINLALEHVSEAFRGKGPLHYALVPWREATEQEVLHWRKHFGIQLLRYKASSGHPEVDKFLERLRRKL